jgi:hypothetical protein
MGMTAAASIRREKERNRAARDRCEACQYCKPDHARLGPGWIEQDNNGPIVSCPVCNPTGAFDRRR